jgi:alpha/beta superfamily hydrolase
MADDLTPTTAVSLHTADGLALEGELALPAECRAAVVLAHPHPLHGGSMRSLVTSELFRSLPAAGVAALRFNFRGVEGSEGDHGGGVDEAGDVVAAIDAVASAAPGVPLVLCGWSFGGDVSLSVDDVRLAGWFLIAPTLRILPLDALVVATDARPKLLAVPEHDEFRPPASAREVTAGWVNTRIEVIKGADHFLVGRTAKAADLLVDFVSSVS